MPCLVPLNTKPHSSVLADLCWNWSDLTNGEEIQELKEIYPRLGRRSNTFLLIPVFSKSWTSSNSRSSHCGLKNVKTFRCPWLLDPRTGAPNLWGLRPGDLKWSWCNNNRNKVHNKCNAFESFWNHPPMPSLIPYPTVFHGKIIFCKTSLVPKRLGTAALEHKLRGAMQPQRDIKWVW